jgi:predicted DNA-binding protein (MmcQ/YjbR family)
VELAISLREHYSEVTPAYHFNKQHWNGIDINGSLSDQLLKEWIDHSYFLVVEGLPKSKREELGK